MSKRQRKGKMKSHKIIAIVAALVCTQAAAQGGNVPEAGNGWRMPYQSAFWRYAAVTVGRSAYDFDFDCPPATSRPCDATDRSAFKLAAGGTFNNTWGIEISYVNLGDVSLPAFRADTRAQGVNLSLIASAKVFDRVGINAKIGAVYGWTRSRLTTANISCILRPDATCNVSQSDRGFGASYGAGLSARVAPRVELRLDWDRYRFPFGQDGLFSDFARVGGKRDVDMWSAGFNVLF